MATSLIMRADHIMEKEHKEKLRGTGLFKLRKSHLRGNSWESTAKAEQSAVPPRRRRARGPTAARHKPQRVTFRSERPAWFLVNFHVYLDAVTHVGERLLQIPSGFVHPLSFLGGGEKRS